MPSGTGVEADHVQTQVRLFAWFVVGHSVTRERCQEHAVFPNYGTRRSTTRQFRFPGDVLRFAPFNRNRRAARCRVAARSPKLRPVVGVSGSPNEQDKCECQYETSAASSHRGVPDKGGK